jgi:hypothetical protein
MTELRAHGLAISVHRGWEASIWLPEAPPPAENHPVMRLTNFPLPRTRDTYAEDAVEDLRSGEIIASLVEFAPRLADRGLYAAQGIPRVSRDDLDARALQRHLPGRYGLQRFFSVRGRAFSLYVIARNGPDLDASLRALTVQLRSLIVEAS